MSRRSAETDESGHTEDRRSEAAGHARRSIRLVGCPAGQVARPDPEAEAEAQPKDYDRNRGFRTAREVAQLLISWVGQKKTRQMHARR
jgi:hypothetical protein